MARPKKDLHEKRSETVKLRLTLAELEYVRGQAAVAGISVSAFLRRRALGLVVQPSPARADAALISELNRVGVNLNQVAKSLNAGRETPHIAITVLGELRAVLARAVRDGA